jgi:hypothetical protein
LAVTGKTTAEKEKVLDQMQALQQEHEGKLLAITQQGEAMRAQVAQKELQDFLKASDERLAVAVQALNREEQQGQISATKRDQLELQLTKTVEQQELARVDAIAAASAKGSKEYETAMAERAKIVKKYNAEIDKDESKLWADTLKNVQTATGPMMQGFNQAINGMIVSGESFNVAMKKMAQSVLQGFLSMFEQLAEKWLETQITNAIVGKTTQATMAVAQVESEANVAAAGAFASTAALPYPANLAAPAASAAAFGAVMAFAPGASAAGGMVLDQNMLVMAHAKEMILPAHLSEGIQGMISGGSGSRGGPVTNNLHYGPTINAPQAQSLRQMLAGDSRAMLGWIAEQSRSGALRKAMGT